VSALAPERFALQFTVGRGTYDKFRYIQALLSHRLPSGDIAQVFDWALDAFMKDLEKQKFAATPKPRPRPRRPSANPRHIPAQVKRAVWERDQGRCTFVSESGQRCGSRKFVEYDHIDPVARGGHATVDGLRLRCRSHNQYEAERTFGAEFMSAKREHARNAAARTSAALSEVRSPAPAQEQARDVMACLRQLGFRAGEARRAVELCATIPEAKLEERVRAALKFLCPKTRFQGRIGTILAAPA
jgi:5-methylcytosine-specific restriction endonuclease McrA